MKITSLNGKTALITGASSGIGKATAIALAREGVNLVLVSRGIERLKEVQAELKNFNVKTVILPGDISNNDEISEIIQKSLSEFETIDFLICSAGMYYRCPAADLSIDEIQKVMDTNFYGTLRCIYQLLPHFRERNTGHIVVISSFEGKRGLPRDAAYVASKFALTGFMEVMRQELYGTSVIISTILPGRINTPMIENIKTPKINTKLPPKMVANAVINAIVKKKKELLVPFLTLKIFLIASCISPTFGDWFTRHYKLQGDDIDKI